MKTSILLLQLLLMGLDSLLEITASELQVHPNNDKILEVINSQTRDKAEINLHDDLTHQRACSCGVKQADTKIVGGTTARQGEFPWRVSIWRGNATQLNFVCGGTVLNERWVLTAAHCVNLWDNGQSVYIGAGSLTIDITHKAERQIIHKDFVLEAFTNDIALLELKTDLNFSSGLISPICLPHNFAGTTSLTGHVVASGWGIQSFDDEQLSDILLKTTLDMITNTQCATMNVNPPITDRNLCAYTPGKSTCKGDSGGSLDFLINDRWYAFGITSHGIGCAGPNSPGIYTRVSEFTDWIEAYTGVRFCRSYN